MYRTYGNSDLLTAFILCREELGLDKNEACPARPMRPPRGHLRPQLRRRFNEGGLRRTRSAAGGGHPALATSRLPRKEVGIEHILQVKEKRQLRQQKRLRRKGSKLLIVDHRSGRWWKHFYWICWYSVRCMLLLWYDWLKKSLWNRNYCSTKI